MMRLGLIPYFSLVTFLLLCGVRAEVSQEGTFTTVLVRYNGESGTFSATADGSFGVLAATVTVNNTFATTGWDVVDVQVDEAFMRLHGEDDFTQRRLGYLAMGYGEGYATQEQLENTLKNNFFGAGGINALINARPDLVTWVDKHVAHMESNIDRQDAYGQELQQLLSLMDGIVLGYNARLSGSDVQLNRTWLFYLNLQEELGEIVGSMSSSTELEELRKTMPRFFVDLHCSALVKVLKDDIYFSHVTWNSFNAMLRQYKTYRVEHRHITMSSYPGLIHSIDDWYMTYTRLAVMETTNGITNGTLLKYITPDSVSEFLRVMVANFLAKDSPDWVQIFSRHNSGTYNNQWMVFNMGAVIRTDGFVLPPDTFWVAEQMPGNTTPLGVTSADMTAHLNKTGFWASYNLPYFESVYNLSGVRSKWETYGDFFSYTECPRAKIFARNQSDVVDLESLKRLMRYNDYKNDPLSLIPNCTGAGTNNTCDPAFSSMLAIASRGDLNPVGNSTNYGPLAHFFGHRNHGATDVKIATWTGMMNQTDNAFVAHVICGPTNDQQPTFEWKEGMFDPMPPLYGLPKVYNFPFMTYTTYAYKPNNGGDTQSSRNKWIGIAIGSVASALVLVAIGTVLYRSWRERKQLAEADALLLD